MDKIISVINNEKVANVFFNLYERWLDEYKYEDINEYGKVLAKAISDSGTRVELVTSTRRPFGCKVNLDGTTYHLYVKAKGSRISLFCKAVEKVKKDESVPVLISDYDCSELSEEQYREYTRPAYVYAHGKLEDDMKTDIVFVKLNGKKLENGLVAKYKDEEVKFFLFNNVFGQTGIVTYVNDKEACEYGEHLLKTRPKTF